MMQTGKKLPFLTKYGDPSSGSNSVDTPTLVVGKESP
jgi:hypothetical protein